MDSTHANISFALAFNHCMHTTSYWIWFIILPIIAVVGGLLINYIGKKSDKDIATAQKVWWILVAFAIMFAIFARPCDVAANTSLSAAAHNQWLGY